MLKEKAKTGGQEGAGMFKVIQCHVFFHCLLVSFVAWLCPRKCTGLTVFVHGYDGPVTIVYDKVCPCAMRGFNRPQHNQDILPKCVVKWLKW